MSGVRRPLRVGTRRSALARRQSADVAAAVEALLDRPVDLVDVTTRGDIDPAPLADIGGTGVFVSALRDALLRGEVDLAVHSLKDLPTAPPDGLALAAVPPRADPRDALCARDGLTLDALPGGARVGTGSPRRAAALRALRPDLDVQQVRGNVDTRLGLVAGGHLDAVVLACAGLARLGRDDAVTEVLQPTLMLPAPGQGALAVEVRDDAPAVLREALARLDDPDSRAAVTAERSLLATLEAGCSAPVGALATVTGGTLTLTAAVLDPNGARQVTGRLSGARVDAVETGRHLALSLLNDGAADLVSLDTKEKAL
jgi:hydroxymethylbilane synthase